MADLQHLADSMLRAAAAVLGRLVDATLDASPARRNDHEGSIRTDGDELVALAEIPSLDARIVVRFPKTDVQHIVATMLGSSDDSADMGPMQLSIASETVSQLAVAMAEQLASDLGASPDRVHAKLCTDPAELPTPPFESYDGTLPFGESAWRASIDVAGIVRSKLSVESPPEAAVPQAAPVAPSVAADVQPIAFTPMQPTVRSASSGSANLDIVHDVPLQISAVLGRTTMALREVVSLQTGTVFELDKLSVEPVDLYVNNILIARGEVVVVDDKYAVKISELNPQVV